jgi:hypothetical protein
LGGDHAPIAINATKCYKWLGPAQGGSVTRRAALLPGNHDVKIEKDISLQFGWFLAVRRAGAWPCSNFIP